MTSQPRENTDFSAINQITATFLLSDRGRAAAQSLADADLHERHTLTLLQSLRKTFDAKEAGALLALARLRQRAQAKFPTAQQLFFTEEALVQATAWPIAQAHAAHIAAHAPPGPILDLGCSIGGDLLALAQERQVIGIDLDPVRLRFAAANATALGLTDRVEFIQADWTVLLRNGQLPKAAAAFADPARRVDGKRVFHLDQLQPPLTALLTLQAQIPEVGIKIMPGVDDREIPADCGVEFISHDGVCKEAVLWFGRLATDRRWASVYAESCNDDNDDDAASAIAGQNCWHRLRADETPPPLGPLDNVTYLHEPDPAIIRAGALGWLCTMLDAHLFDAQIAYLVAERNLGTMAMAQGLVQSFQIEEIHPFSLKLLNRRLQALDIHHVELKKRGFPQAPEELRSRLKLAKTGRSGVVIFTRHSDGHSDERLMLIGRRVVQ